MNTDTMMDEPDMDPNGASLDSTPTVSSETEGQLEGDQLFNAGIKKAARDRKLQATVGGEDGNRREPWVFGP